MPVAVHLLLIKENRILLLRRKNTGYEDGNYSLIAGHIEANETVISAMRREAKEEAGIILEDAYLKIAQVMHRKGTDENRIDYFLLSDRWTGELKNCEPEKCDDLSWFPLDQLPKNTIGYIQAAIMHHVHGDSFTSYGWM